MDDDDLLLREKEFCPPIDPALFFAICSDYDLSNSESIEELRTVLKGLKESVIAESDTFFDPSGTSGGPPEDSSSQGSSSRAQLWQGELPSEDTEPTDFSHSLQSLSLNGDIDNEAQREDDARRKQHDVELENLSVGEKSTLLLEMFPTKTLFDVNFILKKVGNNFGRAVEELLNHAFLEEEAVGSGEPIFHKGIDGFAEPLDSGSRKGRRGKRKKETRRTSSTPNPSAPSETIIPHYLPHPHTPPSPRNSPISPFPPVARPTTTAHLLSLRSTAFAQASASSRKAQSSPLMAGAASYYSALGRDLSASLSRHETALAEATVTAQSPRADEIDLHGVSVRDGVRIARDRVERWWGLEGGGEWAREGRVMKGSGFRIVTGKGTHSEGGRGRLGPAVGGMLVREGWRVEVTEGVVAVTGRARK